jgi:serine/threonine-protein kinase RsbW
VAAPDDALRIDIANAADLDRLHPWFDGEARDLPDPMRHRMRVVLEEAVLNAVMHGFAPGTPGEITVQLRVSPDTASLLVEDSGAAFDPTLVSERQRPTSLLEAERGGLGLTLLRHFCQDISHARVGGRNRLTLRFPLPIE